MRLAHERGIFTSPKLNHFQHFGLLYWLYLSRRDSNELLRDELEVQCFNLAFPRWAELYQGTSGSILDPGTTDDGDIPVDDIEEIDRWYAQREAPRSMNGAATASATPQGWSEWT